MENMKTKDLVDFILKNKNIQLIYSVDSVMKLNVNNTIVEFDLLSERYHIKDLKFDRANCFNLKNDENKSTLMLILKLLAAGYSANTITLEKSWQTGHDPVYADLMLENPSSNEIYLFEVKTIDEFYRYTDINNESKIKQLFSYAMQEKNTKIVSFYSFDFLNSKDLFANVFCFDLRKNSTNVDDFYERWNKVFDNIDYISSNPVFNITKKIKKFNDLVNISANDTKMLFNQFLTILRLNSISDKPNAFIRMINLFLAKISDELTENKYFKIVDKNGLSHNFNGVKFQYIDGIDTPASFMKRLGDLYKYGMKEYMKKSIIDFTDDELEELISGENKIQLAKAFDDLRLKKNNNFSFIEIYDEKTFLENFEVVRDLVLILENFRFKYETKQQFLGDFFENLLNTSLKQEAGQFFTPYPLVDYMIDSIDFESNILNKILEKKVDFIPSIIDYACGAGHFLISSMKKVQEILENIDDSSLTMTQRNKLLNFKKNPYSWVNREKIIGIEKDYRLAKTTKIATFLNGDGDAEIIAGDGINKFDSPDYKDTILSTKNKTNEIFDYLISNPPYSIDGFMNNFLKNNINQKSGDFSILKDELNFKDSAIEIYFVERMYQLLKKNGIGSIVLPQSILSQDKYRGLRRFIFENFKVLSLLLTADITFSGTSTSPVILFLKKKDNKNVDINYKILVVTSPKYLNPTLSKMRKEETKFLGYEFSSNRSKSGITLIEDSYLSKISIINQNFIKNGTSLIDKSIEKYCKIVNLNDITVNICDSNCGDIYPKIIKIDGPKIGDLFDINKWQDSDFSDESLAYLEIGDLETQTPSKSKKSNRFCKKGDILLSSLTPRSSKIVIAKSNFMVTSAVHVLSFKENLNDVERSKIYIEIKKDYILKQMNSLLDGFKVTYAKISDKNLINNVYFNKNFL